MLTSESGRFADVRLMHLKKTESGRALSDPGSFISTRLLQFANAALPIDVTVSGSVTETTGRPLKVPSAMDVTGLPLIFCGTFTCSLSADTPFISQ